ncbi:MAG: 50S ribosomal protein L3 [Candidatus Cloacimonetes bacterium]|nr:50S ribosomal protein L3 [Candidatus Cloacimonadota bacterium]
MKKLTGKKVEMSQVFKDNGTVVPVTILSLERISGLNVGDKIKVSGISKGKGFAGAMKRWGFSGGPKTHGQSDRARAPGSIGTQDMARVWKGKKMAGRMGGDKITIRGLEVVEVDSEKKLIKVKGAVPGARNSKVIVSRQ